MSLFLNTNLQNFNFAVGCGDFVVRSAYLLSLVLVWVNVFAGTDPEGVF